MSRFKTRRDFINKSITLSLGVGLTKLSILEEVMKNQHPNNRLQSNELKQLIDNSPLVAYGKGDVTKDGCCAYDFPNGYECFDKK